MSHLSSVVIIFSIHLKLKSLKKPDSPDKKFYFLKTVDKYLNERAVLLEAHAINLQKLKFYFKKKQQDL